VQSIHNNYSDSGQVYCYKEDNKIMISSHGDKCLDCAYFSGTMVGQGVSCKFDDACDSKDELYFDDWGDSELHCKMQDVRLGRKTINQVINSLKSYNDYSHLLETEETEEIIDEEKETEK